MSYRSSQILIQPETKNRLRLAIKLYPEVVMTRPYDMEGGNCILTVDELADRKLNEMVEREFPDVIELEQGLATAKEELNAIEKKAIYRLQNARKKNTTET